MAVSDEKKIVAVDTDFIHHLGECHISDKDLFESTSELLKALFFQMVIHYLVHEKEVKTENQRISGLLNSLEVKIMNIDDIFNGDDAKKAYYSMQVRELFRIHTGSTIPDKEDVFEYWQYRASLGEIHSIAMCVICGYGIFLSDDKDVKKLIAEVKQKYINGIEVYNRKDLIDQYMKTENPILTRKIRSSLTHKVCN